MNQVSIIIPTYNGAHKIVKVLNALEKQSFKNFEVIVVIDGSTDHTKDVLSSSTFDLQKLVILEQHNGGRSVSRNAGAKIAQGDLLIFFDDDMRPVEQCVFYHQEHHAQNKSSIMVGSQLEDFQFMETDIQQYKGELSRIWEVPLLQNKGALAKENLFITAANFSLPRNTFFTLSGFDERLTDAEDFDLAVRAYKAGISIFYNPKAIGWHDDFISWESYITRQRQYSRAHKKLIALKPWMEEEGFIKPVKLPAGFKKKMFKFFSCQPWVELVKSPGVLLLPKKIRYKLYDLVITGNGILYPDRVKL